MSAPPAFQVPSPGFRPAPRDPVELTDTSSNPAESALSYRKRRAHMIAVESAERPETRTRRVEKVVGELSA